MINKQEIMLMDDIIDRNRSSLGDSNVAKIVREENGFRLEILNRENFLIKVNKVCFFLDTNCTILAGNPRAPEIKLEVKYLDFPKVRVNFNGFRIKTSEKDMNWSNYYMINEKREKAGLHLERAPESPKASLNAVHDKTSADESMILSDKNKQYFIGSEDHCDLRTTKGGVLGVIKYLEDIGWIIQSKGLTKENTNMGVYILLKPTVTHFKLYQGMSVQTGAHLVTVKELV